MLTNYAKFLVCMTCAIGSPLLAAQEVGTSPAVSNRATPPSQEMSASGIEIPDYHGRFALAKSGSPELKASNDACAPSVKSTPVSALSAVKPLPDIDAMAPLDSDVRFHK